MIVLRAVCQDGSSAFVAQPPVHGVRNAGDALEGDAYCWPPKMSARDRAYFKTFLRKLQSAHWMAIEVDALKPGAVGAIFERGTVIASGALQDVRQHAPLHDINKMLDAGKAKNARRRDARKQKKEARRYAACA